MKLTQLTTRDQRKTTESSCKSILHRKMEQASKVGCFNHTTNLIAALLLATFLLAGNLTSALSPQARICTKNCSVSRVATRSESYVITHNKIKSNRAISSSNPTLINQKMKHDNEDTKITLTSNRSNVEVQTWNPLRLLVLRLGLTELKGTSPLNYGKYDGVFKCAYCGNILFDSSAKYDSQSGWPSFWRSAESHSVRYKVEFDGRLECKCQRCSSHLGHVFLDGPRPYSVDSYSLGASPTTDPRGRNENSSLPRFCVNGAALRYQARGSSNE